MINNKIIELFQSKSNVFLIEGNGQLYPDINKDDEKHYRDIISIPNEETVLLINKVVRGIYAHTLVAITDWGIRMFKNKPGTMFPVDKNISWEEMVSINLEQGFPYSTFKIHIQCLNTVEVFELPSHFITSANPGDIRLLEISKLFGKIIAQAKNPTSTQIESEPQLTYQHKIIELYDFYSYSLWTVGRNSLDSMGRPNIVGEISFRNNFNIGKDETILYCRDTSFWNNRNQGCVVTDWGIHAIPSNDNPDKIIKISWARVNDVSTDELIIYFWGKEKNNTEDYLYLPANYFFKDNISDSNCQNLVKLFKMFIQSSVSHKHPAEVVLGKMQAIEESNSVKAWEIGLKALGKYPDWDGILKWELGSIAYLHLHDNNRALDMFTQCLKEENLPDECKSLANYWSSNILYEKDDAQLTIRQLLFNTAKGNKEVKYNEDVLLWQQAKTEIRGFERIYFGEKLSERPYAERNLIFPVEDVLSLSSLSYNQVIPVNIDSLLEISDLKFPIGHPQCNQLYVAHPHDPKVYFLYDDYEIEILKEKLREFSDIAQALGAIELDVKLENSSGQNVASNKMQYLKGSVDHWMGEVVADNKITSSLIEEHNLEHKFNRHQTFVARLTPSMPEKTVWLQNEPNWQQLIKQRMNGGMLSHNEVIETKSSRIVSGSVSNQLKGELKTIFVDLGFEWNREEEIRYSEHRNLVLSVDVKFGQELSTCSQSIGGLSLNKKELEYKVEYEACLNEGQINPSVRRLLDRLAKNLGLTIEQISKIEDLCSIPMSEAEKEYLNEYRACIQDNQEMTSSTRRLLNRMAMSLGLTEEQVSKLEDQA